MNKVMFKCNMLNFNHSNTFSTGLVRRCFPSFGGVFVGNNGLLL